MRLDKCYRSWKQDLETGFSAFEASLDRFVDLTKPDFVGKAALLAERERGVRQRLVPLTLDEPGEADAPFCAPVHARRRAGGARYLGFLELHARAQRRAGLCPRRSCGIR